MKRQSSRNTLNAASSRLPRNGEPRTAACLRDGALKIRWWSLVQAPALPDRVQTSAPPLHRSISCSEPLLQHNTTMVSQRQATLLLPITDNTCHILSSPLSTFFATCIWILQLYPTRLTTFSKRTLQDAGPFILKIKNEANPESKYLLNPVLEVQIGSRLNC